MKSFFLGLLSLAPVVYIFFVIMTALVEVTFNYITKDVGHIRRLNLEKYVFCEEYVVSILFSLMYLAVTALLGALVGEVSGCASVGVRFLAVLNTIIIFFAILAASLRRWVAKVYG